VKDLVVIGGGHAKVVIATARAAGYEVIGILDEDETKHGRVILDVPITGGLDLLRSGIYERAVIAIGDNRKRQRVARYYKGFCTWVTLIHLILLYILRARLVMVPWFLLELLYNLKLLLVNIVL